MTEELGFNVVYCVNDEGAGLQPIVYCVDDEGAWLQPVV